MLLALQHFQETLDPEDEELPTGIHDTLNQLRQKLELVKVRYNTYTYFIMTGIDVAKCTLPSQKSIQPFSFKSIHLGRLERTDSANSKPRICCCKCDVDCYIIYSDFWSDGGRMPSSDQSYLTSRCIDDV